MNKMFLLGVFLFYCSIAHGQPVPDCARTKKRLFIVSKDNLVSDLSNYNAIPTSLGPWATCFRVDKWKFADNDTLSFYSFKIYFLKTPWPPEKYGKYDSSMTITIIAKQLPDSFNYYLDVTYNKGKYCVNLSDSLKNKTIEVPCDMCREGKTVTAIDITPIKWIQCQNEDQSFKKKQDKSKKKSKKAEG